MTSLSDPPCLIEHEHYVKNAVWILHTLSTWECSSNERLRPRGRGDTLIFSYIHWLGPLFGLKFWISIIFFLFSEKWIFLGDMKYIFGVLVIPDIFLGWTVDAGPKPTYEEQIRVSPPPPQGLRAVLCRLKGPLDCEKMLILMSWFIKNCFSKKR